MKKIKPRDSPLTREEGLFLYAETGDKRYLDPDGTPWLVKKKKYPYALRRLPGEPTIKMPEPTFAEKEKRKKLIKELRKVTGDKDYDGIAHLPPEHVGSRWYKVKARRSVY